MEQFSSDLDPSQFDNIGPTEAAIYRTPEGTAFIDVLASKNQNQAIDKNTKDYDTLKWEQELRAQLAQKKGQTKKLTADEQAKIVAQITKESMIRKNVAIVDAKVRRGVGIVSSLASGPPTEADHWLGQAVDCLLKVIRSGAGLLVGDLASLAFISCSKRISSRLGNLRPFIGSAILRATGTSQLPAEYNEEKLVGRFLGEPDPRRATNLDRFGDTSALQVEINERTATVRYANSTLRFSTYISGFRKGRHRLFNRR